jgi:hypothetical protein
VLEYVGLVRLAKGFGESRVYRLASAEHACKSHGARRDVTSNGSLRVQFLPALPFPRTFSVRYLSWHTLGLLPIGDASRDGREGDGMLVASSRRNHAQYRNLEALAHRGEHVSSPRRIPVLGGSRGLRRSIWMGRCPQGRDGGGVQTIHHLAGPGSAGSGGWADLRPHGTSESGLTKHHVVPHADGNSAAGPANGLT